MVSMMGRPIRHCRRLRTLHAESLGHKWKLLTWYFFIREASRHSRWLQGGERASRFHKSSCFERYFSDGVNQDPARRGMPRVSLRLCIWLYRQIHSVKSLGIEDYKKPSQPEMEAAALSSLCMGLGSLDIRFYSTLSDVIREACSLLLRQTSPVSRWV